ncbi:MAG: hypothetical protein H6739_10905 [Alphaproteobacteria bacterium]|nr:hypothetical protein [Alphaproteobacteria bacterium]
MSSSAIIAVYTKSRRSSDARSWKGVHHFGDGAPWELGNELLFRVRRSRGDLAAVVQELIIDAPYGWQSIAHLKRAEKDDQLRYYSPKLLRGADGVEVSWLHLFDVDERRLDIYRVDRSQPSGHEPDAVASVTFNERGRSTPHQLVAPPPPWLTMEVASGWQDEMSEGVRERVVELMDDWTEQAGFTAEDLVDRVAAAISAAILRTCSGPDANGLVYVRFPSTEDSRYWALALPGFTLRYPTRSARRHAANVGRSLGDHLQLFDGERAETTLHLDPAALADCLDTPDWPEAWPEPEIAVGAMLVAVASAKMPGALYRVEGLQLIREKQVVEDVRVPLREVSFADVRRRDKRVRVGDMESRTTSVDFIWTVLDWIRSFELMEEDDDAWGEE